MTMRSTPAQIELSDVTLCAVTSVNLQATVYALEACLDQIRFKHCKLFTDSEILIKNPDICVISIEKLNSAAAYSDFLLSRLADHIETSHVLVAQWDGHILDAKRWRPEFLDYDYIGASWPQFCDSHDVGNGGFSLRSKRLMNACREPGFRPLHPEDLAIGRTNRNWLEDQGLRFAPRELADLFAVERAGNLGTAFGYHGVWNMPEAIGLQSFWKIYRELDELGSVRVDFWKILRQVARAKPGWGVRMVLDRCLRAIGRP